MKKSILGALVIIGVIALGLIISILINNKNNKIIIDDDIINDTLVRNYFDIYSYNKTINGKSTNITIKYYKDDFKYEDSCFKVYFDIFADGKIVKSYREGSPYEVKVSSQIYTSNYCAYDNSEVDDIKSVTDNISKYLNENTYIIKGDKEYLGMVLPVIYVSSYNEAKLLIINGEGENIYTSLIQKQKEDIVSMEECTIKYNKALYGSNVNIIKADNNSFYYIKIDAHHLGEVNTLAENKIVINNDEVEVEIVNKCSGK